MMFDLFTEQLLKEFENIDLVKQGQAANLSELDKKNLAIKLLDHLQQRANDLTSYSTSENPKFFDLSDLTGLFGYIDRNHFLWQGVPIVVRTGGAGEQLPEQLQNTLSQHRKDYVKIDPYWVYKTGLIEFLRELKALIVNITDPVEKVYYTELVNARIGDVQRDIRLNITMPAEITKEDKKDTGAKEDKQQIQKTVEPNIYTEIVDTIPTYIDFDNLPQSHGTLNLTLGNFKNNDTLQELRTKITAIDGGKQFNLGYYKNQLRCKFFNYLLTKAEHPAEIHNPKTHQIYLDVLKKWIEKSDCQISTTEALTSATPIKTTDTIDEFKDPWKTPEKQKTVSELTNYLRSIPLPFVDKRIDLMKIEAFSQGMYILFMTPDYKSVAKELGLDIEGLNDSVRQVVPQLNDISALLKTRSFPFDVMYRSQLVQNFMYNMGFANLQQARMVALGLSNVCYYVTGIIVILSQNPTMSSIFGTEPLKRQKSLGDTYHQSARMIAGELELILQSPVRK